MATATTEQDFQILAMDILGEAISNIGKEHYEDASANLVEASKTIIDLCDEFEFGRTSGSEWISPHLKDTTDG